MLEVLMVIKLGIMNLWSLLMFQTPIKLFFRPILISTFNNNSEDNL